ncbi:nicotinate-nucleotide--dimethylbenzimidazole phosphoribosyltransferase [Methylosinus sp. Sm6]|uniref:nicotinate-nucleotide--dimethylbenzimidazole phosphoribosyltransferase n=1 Tax=Methylosinus sp. Sm6 TaxID=2866948 RepID=UPI001C994DB5|nr:nicotinate-nucleotide--dimethylbenzimidazole phosphoribosyltransferase [Methylosinus sp. Sm6]MBY6239888.1 nicotinate-nucleotide--dimethylbenzimidazole phosphoribosyltransferase [Methylosinus sp. Sm6]
MTFHTPVLPPFDPVLAARLRARINGLAKPPGALGRLEELALQLALIQETERPSIDRVEAYVFAGDHGLTAEGVSAYPSAVTAAMVATFLAGRASVNALAAACGVEVIVVDAGVDAELAVHPGLVAAKIRRGSRNAAVEPALTAAEAAAALARGGEIAAASQAEALVVGEMGIGNSASAALIMHRLAPASLADCVGAGAGHDAAGLARKLAALERAAARSDAREPLAVLAEFGGLEIAMMAGAFLGGAAAGKAMVADGFISSAAALVALRLSPGLAERLIFAHASAERGHAGMLAAIGARPLLDLGMRLGEGSGGVLAAPLLRSAARLMSETAALEDVLAGRL